MRVSLTFVKYIFIFYITRKMLILWSDPNKISEVFVVVYEKVLKASIEINWAIKKLWVI